MQIEARLRLNKDLPRKFDGKHRRRQNLEEADPEVVEKDFEGLHLRRGLVRHDIERQGVARARSADDHLNYALEPIDPGKFGLWLMPAAGMVGGSGDGARHRT